VCHTGRDPHTTSPGQGRSPQSEQKHQRMSVTAIQVSCEDGSKITLSKEKSKPLDRWCRRLSSP
jgi:hypothetical protein